MAGEPSGIALHICQFPGLSLKALNAIFFFKSKHWLGKGRTPSRHLASAKRQRGSAGTVSQYRILAEANTFTSFLFTQSSHRGRGWDVKSWLLGQRPSSQCLWDPLGWPFVMTYFLLLFLLLKWALDDERNSWIEEEYLARVVCESTPLGTDSEEGKGAALTQKKTVNGGPVAKTPGSQRRGSRLDPWSGN